jgi:hypothetical protein
MAASVRNHSGQDKTSARPLERSMKPSLVRKRTIDVLIEMMRAAHPSPQVNEDQRQRVKPMELSERLSHRVTMSMTRPRSTHKIN